MRRLFIAIGLVFLLGGGVALLEPKRTLVPHFAGRFGKLDSEDVSKERAEVYGFISLATGTGILALVFLFRRELSDPPAKPNDYL